MSATQFDLAEAIGELTLKQRRFCEAYAGEAAGNATKAAELAGYAGSYETLAVSAYDNLRNPKITRVLEAYMESDPLVMGRVERLRTLSRVARGDTTDERLDKDGCRVELRSSTADRLKAMDMLAKAAGEKLRLEVTTTPDKLDDATLAAVLAAHGIQAGQLSDAGGTVNFDADHVEASAPGSDGAEPEQAGHPVDD